jgi:hypothetical protein
MTLRLTLSLLVALMLTFAGTAAFGSVLQPKPLKVIATVYAHAHRHTAAHREYYTAS